MSRNPIAQGSLIAIAAAALFGFTTPLVKHFGAHAGAFASAMLLYAGAAIGGGLPGRRSQERGLSKREVRRLALVAFFGAALAPAALAWGLQRSGSLAGSLLLNLEAVFTVALAAVIYREPIGRRVALACLLMLAGGAVLVLRTHVGEASSALGLLALCGATLAWAFDNTLTRPLADFDPRQVVFWKATLGAALSGCASLALRESWPTASAGLGLLACGASGYGLSLRLYLRAQRTLGAARTGSLFALAPFMGAATAFVAGDRAGAELIPLAAVFFGIAAYLHVSEQHHHRHHHDPLDHDHIHSHDDGHHDHVHDPAVIGSHRHPHHHEATDHDHAHGSDLHHRHAHR